MNNVNIITTTTTTMITVTITLTITIPITVSMKPAVNNNDCYKNNSNSYKNNNNNEGIQQWTLHKVALVVHCDHPCPTEIWNVRFYEGRKTEGPAGKPEDLRENRRTRGKTLGAGENPRSRDVNQQKTQPTCDTSSGNWTQTAVEILDFPAHTS